jgi:hypothetical protein
MWAAGREHLDCSKRFDLERLVFMGCPGKIILFAAHNYFYIFFKLGLIDLPQVGPIANCTCN